MADETTQPINHPPEYNPEHPSQDAPRRDSVVADFESAKTPKEMKKEMFTTTTGYISSNSSDPSSSDSESPVARQVALTQSIHNPIEAYTPQQAPNQKRDSKTGADLLVPQQIRRKYGEKRPSPPLDAQTSFTGELGGGDVLLGDTANADVEMKDASDTDQPPSTSQTMLTASSDSARDQSTDMPPPAAPASMLWNMTPSDTAKGPGEVVEDLYIMGRLGTAVVTLFRLGKAKEAKALAQYTIDLIGQENWNELLKEYMPVDSEPDAEEWVAPLLQDVIVVLKQYDPASSGFLNVLLPFLVQR